MLRITVGDFCEPSIQGSGFIIRSTNTEVLSWIEIFTRSQMTGWRGNPIRVFCEWPSRRRLDSSYLLRLRKDSSVDSRTVIMKTNARCRRRSVRHERVHRSSTTMLPHVVLLESTLREIVIPLATTCCFDCCDVCQLSRYVHIRNGIPAVDLSSAFIMTREISHGSKNRIRLQRKRSYLFNHPTKIYKR